MHSADPKSASTDGLDHLFTNEPPKVERFWQICLLGRVK
jgi:hypothetical protein